ncbi:MAG: ROK family protein [Gammaproteobacteria bacterium]|nr:ROK family protein [Gammaproteobacteria bacterium]
MGTRETFIGGVEAGGTTFKCAIATSPSHLVAQTSIPTTTPDTTMRHIEAFFLEQKSRFNPIASCGLAAFGPLELNHDSPDFGKILETPKKAWQQFNIVGALEHMTGVPVAIDTDVNAAALAESQLGASRDAVTSVYVTVGTGIGTGVVQGGKSIRSPLHPEGGHMFVPQDKTIDKFSGCCPFHDGCLEGLASGMAIEARWGKPAAELPDNHPAWSLEASYLAYLCVNLFRVLGPEKIILGGGVLERKGLLNRVRKRFFDLLGGYHMHDVRVMSDLIVAPELGSDAGLAGAVILAGQALEPGAVRFEHA